MKVRRWGGAGRFLIGCVQKVISGNSLRRSAPQRPAPHDEARGETKNLEGGSCSKTSVYIYNNSTTILHLYSIEPPPPYGGRIVKMACILAYILGSKLGFIWIQMFYNRFPPCIFQSVVSCGHREFKEEEEVLIGSQVHTVKGKQCNSKSFNIPLLKQELQMGCLVKIQIVGWRVEGGGLK